jgi:hypothetical protein
VTAERQVAIPPIAGRPQAQARILADRGEHATVGTEGGGVDRADVAYQVDTESRAFRRIVEGRDVAVGGDGDAPVRAHRERRRGEPRDAEDRRRSRQREFEARVTIVRDVEPIRGRGQLQVDVERRRERRIERRTTLHHELEIAGRMRRLEQVAVAAPLEQGHRADDREGEEAHRDSPAPRPQAARGETTLRRPRLCRGVEKAQGRFETSAVALGPGGVRRLEQAPAQGDFEFRIAP